MNKLLVLPFHETSKQNNWQTPMKLKWISKQITKKRRKHLHVLKNQCDVFQQNLGWRVYYGGHNYTVKYPEIKKIKSSQHSIFFFYFVFSSKNKIYLLNQFCCLPQCQLNSLKKIQKDGCIPAQVLWNLFKWEMRISFISVSKIVFFFKETDHKCTGTNVVTDK